MSEESRSRSLKYSAAQSKLDWCCCCRVVRGATYTADRLYCCCRARCQSSLQTSHGSSSDWVGWSKRCHLQLLLLSRPPWPVYRLFRSFVYIHVASLYNEYNHLTTLVFSFLFPLLISGIWRISNIKERHSCLPLTCKHLWPPRSHSFHLRLDDSKTSASIKSSSLKSHHCKIAPIISAWQSN